MLSLSVTLTLSLIHYYRFRYKNQYTHFTHHYTYISVVTLASVLTEAGCLRQWRTQEFCSGGGLINSVKYRRQREWGYGGSTNLIRGSGGSCNLVQEI